MFVIKLFKWLCGFLISIVVLILLAIVIVPQVFDPNDYRGQISELVQQKTGRDLQLNGDLSVSVFPWLGIRTQGLSLSQPEQIGGAMVQVETAQLRLKIMPLLSKRVEIDTVILEQPQLRFITLENGINSLTGLAEETAEEQAAEAEPASPEMALALVIQGVELTDGSLEWDDRQAKQRYQVNDLQLITGNLIGNSLADIELSGTMLDLSDPSVDVQPLEFSVDGQALINTDSLLVTAKDLVTAVDYADYQLGAEIGDFSFDTTNSKLAVNTLSLDVNAANIAEQTLQATTTINTLAFDLSSTQIALDALAVNAEFADQPIKLNIPSISANLDNQSASIATTELISNDLSVLVNDLVVTNFIDNLKAQGSLDVPNFDAADLLTRFDIDYEASDSSAMTSVGLNTNFNAGLDAVQLTGINVILDETTLTGNFSARDFDQLALNFDLVLNSINLDRYLPEDDSSESDSGESVSGADALAVPMALFKDINANGSFKADQFTSSGVELTDIDVQIESSPGKVSVVPTAQLYDGELAGSIVYTEQGEVSQLQVKNKIGVVDLAKFLTAADVSEQLSGFGTVDLDVIVTERNGVQSNEGTIKLFAKDGSVQGIDIKNMIDQAYSTYQSLSGKESTDTQDGESEQDDATGFAELLGTFNLKDFNLSNNDFQVNAPFFRIAGNGDIDLAAQNLDYTINVAIVKSVAGQGGAAVDELDGLTLPIRLRGSLLAPSYSLDTKALYQSLAKAKVEEKKSEFVQEKLGIETDGEVSTKDILRGLLEKEIQDDDEEAAPSPTTDTDVVANQEVANSLDQQSIEQEPELTDEEKEEKAKDDLKDELKNKLLDSLFN